MRFVVVADTHVRSDEADPGDFPANSQLAGRNRYAVDVIEQLHPEFVIHLGDVVHPVPGSPAHGSANKLAAEAYEQLSAPLYMVPGNHDVGDKPYRWVDAPSASPEHYQNFTQRYGPRHQSFERQGCRFVLLDTPVLNTGWEAEAEQWHWLKGTLEAATDVGERIFLFGHYPLYLWDPAEQEHYDNLAEPARARLLDLIAKHRVEAVFAGHVHRFFHARYGDTDLYVAPATGFVRPEYSELDVIAPDDQYGRNDTAKLGLFVVDVGATGHTIQPVRTCGRTAHDSAVNVAELARTDWSLRLSVTMRQGWAAPRDLAMDGLDRFVRKRVRDDSTVLALWEARISRVRIPLADLLHADSRRRVAELAAKGCRFTAVVPGAELLVPGTESVERVSAMAGVERWEVVLPDGVSWGDGPQRPDSGLVAVGPVVPVSGRGWSGDHFVAHGFAPHTDPGRVATVVGSADEAVFRVGHDEPVQESVGAAVETALGCGIGAVIIVELPHLTEGRMFDDDAAVANLAIEAESAAREHPECTVMLDGFVDRDRGYFPRHGLLDRRGDPRDSFRALIRFAATLSQPAASGP